MPFPHRPLNGVTWKIRTLRGFDAHVIASAPTDDCVKELAASMPDRATFAKGLAAAASFFHEFAELAEDAEIRFLDACVAVAP